VTSVGSARCGYLRAVPVYLFDHKPSACPFGHELSGGRYQVGWTPCICQPAKEAAARKRGMGHAVLYCRACEDEGRGTVYYEPAHDVKQWHVR